MHRFRTRFLAAAMVASASLATVQTAAHAGGPPDSPTFWLSNPTSTTWIVEQTSEGAWPTVNFPSCALPVDCAAIIPTNQPIGSSNYSTRVTLTGGCHETVCQGGRYEATLISESGLVSGSVNYDALYPAIGRAAGPAILSCSGVGEATCSSYDLTGVLGTTDSLSSGMQSAAISNTIRVRNHQQLIVPVAVYAKTSKRAPLRIAVKRGAKTIGREHAKVSTNKPLQIPIATKDHVTRGLSGGRHVKLRVRLSHRLPAGHWVSHAHGFQGVQETKEMRSMFADLGPVGLR